MIVLCSLTLFITQMDYIITTKADSTYFYYMCINEQHITYFSRVGIERTISSTIVSRFVDVATYMYVNTLDCHIKVLHFECNSVGNIIHLDPWIASRTHFCTVVMLLQLLYY